MKCTDAYLKELSELKADGAPPIDPRAIRAVKEFCIMHLIEKEHLLPDVVPTNKGGLMLAWDGEDYTLDFGPDGKQVRE